MAHPPIFVISALLLLIPILPRFALAETERQAPAVSSPPASLARTGAETTPATAAAPGKAGAPPADVAAQSTSAPPKKTSGNRRWLIKQRDVAGTVKLGKAAPVKWTSPQQQARCEALLPRLRESFDKARYYSIQGDSCKTAAHASRFLEAYANGDTQCPAGYLKGLGYRDLVPRNMHLLVDLGEARCLDRPKTDASRRASAPAKSPTP